LQIAINVKRYFAPPAQVHLTHALAGSIMTSVVGDMHRNKCKQRIRDNLWLRLV